MVNDTLKGLQLLRPGGMMLWHDFCPEPEIRQNFESAKGVTAAIGQLLPEIMPRMKTLAWINPSWILLGIKK